jgi:hypothetical protein
VADLLSQSAAWLARQFIKHAGREVRYCRGSSVLQLQATVGRTEFQVDDGYGLLVRHESRDFLIPASDLVLSGVATLPKPGDQIQEEQDNIVYIYEVMAPGKEPCWRFSDLYRNTLRIHTKHTATICNRNLSTFRAWAFQALTFKSWTGSS